MVRRCFATFRWKITIKCQRGTKCFESTQYALQTSKRAQHIVEDTHEHERLTPEPAHENRNTEMYHTLKGLL